MVASDGTGIWGSKMVLGDRAKGGPLPRPRARSVAAAERACQTSDRSLRDSDRVVRLALLAALGEDGDVLEEGVPDTLIPPAGGRHERIAGVLIVVADSSGTGDRGR